MRYNYIEKLYKLLNDTQFIRKIQKSDPKKTLRKLYYLIIIYLKVSVLSLEIDTMC